MTMFILTQKIPLLNRLRPGINILGHHTVGYITTVVNSDYLEPCDYEIKRHINQDLESQEVK